MRIRISSANSDCDYGNVCQSVIAITLNIEFSNYIRSQPGTATHGTVGELDRLAPYVLDPG